MGSEKRDEIVDLDALEFADDIEEIVISDYSGEEEDPDVEIVESSSRNTSTSELKISSVVSCKEIEFSSGTIIAIDSGQENKRSSIEIDPEINVPLGLEREKGEDSSSDTFSYDSLTDGEEVENISSKHSATLARNRRSKLNKIYHYLWKSITSESSKPNCNKEELLKTTSDMIKKLTVEGRKLEYSAELCLQSNYKLKRRVKRLNKKKRKHNEDPRLAPGPGKVVTSRASI